MVLSLTQPLSTCQEARKYFSSSNDAFCTVMCPLFPGITRLAADHQHLILWPRLAEVKPGRMLSSPHGSQEAKRGALYHSAVQSWTARILSENIVSNIVPPLFPLEPLQAGAPEQMKQERIHQGGAEVDGAGDELLLITGSSSYCSQLIPAKNDA